VTHDREKEEMQEHLHTAFRQSEGLCARVNMLDQLLERTTEAVSSDCLSTSVAKIEHRLGLLEDELGHVCVALTLVQQSISTTDRLLLVWVRAGYRSC